jgi:prepilin-type N-terminal cleavage/methylation domain-containing protein
MKSKTWERSPIHPGSPRAGFSLIELLVVVAIALIVTAIAIPAIKRTVGNYRLDSSGHSVASMLQEVRMIAVKTNQPYYAQYNVAGVAGVTPNMVIAVPASRENFPPNGAQYNASTDPTVITAGNINFPAAAGVLPNHAQLENVLGVAAGAANTGGVIGFNARGVPCQANGNQWLCGGGATAFEWFMQDSMTQGWEAVTVSPAGRIKSWHLASTNGSCGFPACWQ